MNAPLRDPGSQPIGALFAEHGDFVFRTLQYLGVPGPALDDGLQDVFVIAHRRWDTFEGRSTPRTWLYGIARRVAFRHRRKDENHRRRFVLTEPTVEGVDAPFEQANARRSVKALLESLDEVKRAAFVLTEVEGFTAAEAAALLEIPLGTVYSRVRAAWTLLREAAHEDMQMSSLRVEMQTERRADLQRALVAACVPSAGIGTAATATTGLGAMAWVWGAAALAVVGLGIGVGMRSDTPASAPGAAPSVDAAKPTAPAMPSALAPAPAARLEVQPARAAEVEAIDRVRSELEPDPSKPAQSPPPRPAAERPEPKRPVSTLVEELVLIRKAKELARDGKPDEAGAVLDEHARRFAEGELSDERDEIRNSLASSGKHGPSAGGK